MFDTVVASIELRSYSLLCKMYQVRGNRQASIKAGAGIGGATISFGLNKFPSIIATITIIGKKRRKAQKLIAQSKPIIESGGIPTKITIATNVIFTNLFIYHGIIIYFKCELLVMAISTYPICSIV